MEPETIILAFVAAIPGILAFYGQVIKDRYNKISEAAKLEADTEQKENDFSLRLHQSTMGMIEPMQLRISFLETALLDRDTTIIDLQKKINDQSIVIADLQVSISALMPKKPRSKRESD